MARQVNSIIDNVIAQENLMKNFIMLSNTKGDLPDFIFIGFIYGDWLETTGQGRDA